MNKRIELAGHLADISGEIICRHYRKPFDIISKLDESPVTIADREVEKALREIIEKEHPEDGIHGEEYGVKESRNGYIWILDPVDGTKSFTIGRPIFGSLIALWKDGIPQLGIIDQPILQERWTGVSGHKTLFNGSLAKTSPCKALQEARIATTSPDMFKSEQRQTVLNSLISASRYMNWGGDCYSYGLLACGWLDLVIEAEMKPHDYAALVPVIEGAGGMICDWGGNPLNEKSDGTVLALGDKALWPEVRKILG